MPSGPETNELQAAREAAARAADAACEGELDGLAITPQAAQVIADHVVAAFLAALPAAVFRDYGEVPGIPHTHALAAALEVGT